ncbi:hypothetical protein [Planctomyces sp. SH-PL14]|uniref:hypothetical protein n=1 Tax=Planctomyces sp. SH-PL14 TaxID=1632864 RepID=UPI00078BD78B|nr:hypothetical protein [Planctomyces sp. SH-PL14]AMV17427.1 hypothetical protein VT03_06015 [Planctomyces sp. SH-PL14]
MGKPTGSSSSSPSQWQKLNDEFAGDPRLAIDPLFALPKELLTAIEAHCPGLLPPSDFRFERRLRELSATGFYRQQTVFSDVLDGHDWGTNEYELEAVGDWQQRVLADQDRDFREVLSTDAFTEALAAQRYAIRHSIESRVRERLLGYSGWLVTHPEYWREVILFQLAHYAVMPEYGECSPQFAVGAKFQGRRRNKNVERAKAELQALFDRWCLSGCCTFHVPEPTRAGMMVGDTIQSPGIRSDGITLFLPWPLLADRSFTVAELFEFHRKKTDLRHLDEWFGKSSKLSYIRYGRMLQLYVYLHLALKQRYRDRLRGSMDDVEVAFAAFWEPTEKSKSALSKGAESVRKLRQALNRRRKACQGVEDQLTGEPSLSESRDGRDKQDRATLVQILKDRLVEVQRLENGDGRKSSASNRRDK